MTTYCDPIVGEDYGGCVGNAEQVAEDQTATCMMQASGVLLVSSMCDVTKVEDRSAANERCMLEIPQEQCQACGELPGVRYITTAPYYYYLLMIPVT